MILLIIGFSIVFFAFSTRPVKANLPAEAVVYTDPLTITGNANDILNITIKAKDFANLNTWQTGLIFDPTVLECQAIYADLDIPDDVFDILAPGNSTLGLKGAIDNTLGEVSLTAVAVTGSIGVTGQSGQSYTLMIAKFKLKESGTFEIHLKDTALLTPYPDAFHIPMSIIDAYTPTWNSLDYQIIIQTNSTGADDTSIKQHNFTQSEGTISFIINSPPERNFNGTSTYTIGYCNVTIPKSFMWGDFTVYVDNIQTTYNIASNDTHNSLYLTYSHTGLPRTIKIKATGVIPEFPSITLLTSLLFTSIAVAILANPTSKKRNQH
jgi:hypothetical protein